jgi:copper(I)-binding protein
MRGTLSRGIIALTLLAAAAAPGLAQGGAHGASHHHHAADAVTAGALRIEQPWSRATPGGAKVAGGYVRITNTGSEPDRLTGGSVSVAGRFQVHEMSESGGVARMRHLERGLAIPPGATVELKPGGYHLMFLDLKEPLKEGQTFRGTLHFEKAGSVPLEYHVLSIGARSAGESGHAH